MNSIRALNVRIKIEAMPTHQPNPEPDGDSPSHYITPYDPAALPKPEEPGEPVTTADSEAAD